MEKLNENEVKAQAAVGVNGQKVKDLGFGYELYKEDRRIFVKTPTGDIKTISKPTEFIIIGLDEETKRKVSSLEKIEKLEEIEKLERQGLCKKYTLEELYKMAFPNREDFCRAFYNMSCKTHDFIEKVRQKKGFITEYVGWEGRHPEADKLLTNAKLIETWRAFFSPDIEVYKLENKYALEFTVRDDIDTFSIVTMIFTKKPTRQDLRDLMALDEVEILILKGLKEEFECWECGRQSSFVDLTADSIEERVANWKDRYCGC